MGKLADQTWRKKIALDETHLDNKRVGTGQSCLLRRAASSGSYAVPRPSNRIHNPELKWVET